MNASDRLPSSRRHDRSSTGDGVQSAHVRGTLSRTSAHKDSTATGGPIKSESGVADPVMGGSRPEGLENASIPWMPSTSTSAFSSLPSPFQRGYFASLLWPHHSPPGFPPAHVRPPSFAAAASMPLGFGAAGWPPAGLVSPTAMFVPYPIPIPLPLPLPIPVPIPINKSATDTSTEVIFGNETHNSNAERPVETNCLSDKSTGDRRNTSVSTTPKSSPASSSSSSETWNVLDLSTGGARTRSSDSSAVNAWTNAATAATVSSTIDASPYLARRSLILDAPAVDRKYLPDQSLPVSGVRSSSLTAVGKRFNHHRRRTTPMPLIKSK